MNAMSRAKRKPWIEAQVAEAPVATPETIIAFKGFDQNLQCRGHQFEVGQTYKLAGDIVVCERGFHACEHPLNVFDYYPPTLSRYAEVQLGGTLSRHGGDTKIAATEITIKAELKIPDLVARAIKWVFDRSKPEGTAATDYQGAASATGIAGKDGIEPDTFYVLRDGKPAAVTGEDA